LSRQLAAHPDLLEGRDCEVSLLFCDIRGFSRISERLGPARTMAWIGEVMGALSECVRDRRGVLVDYIGDELLAMWGAPEEQADHPQLACHAALDMLDRLGPLNERWQPILEEPLRLGIGINTGKAHVGNTGSRYKFKYGPLGNTVNLASRIEGATKYLKCRLLIGGATRDRLDSSFAARRVCKVQVLNIAKAVDLHELVRTGLPNWTGLQLGYETALEEFEKNNFRVAARILSNLLAQHPDDGPSIMLLARAVNCLADEPPEHHPVWRLPGK